MTAEIHDFISESPKTMFALMRDFVEKKDVNSRVAIRLRMKALLDFVSVDTEFPPNPMLKMDAAPAPAREASIYGAAAMEWPAQVARPVAIAGVDPQRIDNTDILGS